MAESKPEIAIIVAMDDKRGIGKDGNLPWPKIPQDMARFRALTVGHPVIMGRKTFESLPLEYRPLPNRTNIVITRELGRSFPKAHSEHSLADAIPFAQMFDSERICIIGGGEIYQAALPLADKLYLTHVHGDFNADTFFPEGYEEQFPVQQNTKKSSHEGLSYTFLDLVKRED